MVAYHEIGTVRACEKKQEQELLLQNCTAVDHTMIPMSTTTRAMLDREADGVNEQTDTDDLYLKSEGHSLGLCLSQIPNKLLLLLLL